MARSVEPLACNMSTPALAAPGPRGMTAVWLTNLAVAMLRVASILVLLSPLLVLAILLG